VVHSHAHLLTSAQTPCFVSAILISRDRSLVELFHRATPQGADEFARGYRNQMTRWGSWIPGRMWWALHFSLQQLRQISRMALIDIEIESQGR
jgi:hypothetical protein